MSQWSGVGTNTARGLKSDFSTFLLLIFSFLGKTLKGALYFFLKKLENRFWVIVKWHLPKCTIFREGAPFPSQKVIMSLRLINLLNAENSGTRIFCEFIYFLLIFLLFLIIFWCKDCLWCFFILNISEFFLNYCSFLIKFWL